VTTDADIDWDALLDAAREVAKSAYAPYSNYPVGAAGVTADGRVIAGCNVENASYGLGLCAECSVISQLYATGGGRLIAIAAVDGDGAPLTPCGRCRQLLFEHGGPDLRVASEHGHTSMAELLPDPFGPDHLEHR